MISSLRGTVLAIGGNHIAVDVHGIGYSVSVTPQHALEVRTGSEITLHTALIVREDDMSLFGFHDVDELRVFDLLRGVTGVGPKSALGVLGVMSPAQIAIAVTMEDDAAFRKVSGIGPKTAKLIVLQLTGKLVAPAAAAHTEAVVPVVSAANDVVIALVGLGWPERTAQQTVDDVLAEQPEERNTQALLRAALQLLGPRQPLGAGSAGRP
ncbi:Holliday junction branch migration protein RuvA [Amnibacterium flavum]|uniref:Holliday junction branch migration complex subunit RuvA n=1 Tax=Amnibacterium flavum TaxID=2173173 RepID=A0A2V1HP56_9MICO|nr:Holliday junction branch migration protein RuvA [Amnibacterium flavum]PVZ94338.1 Holliday junction branch migration protein RuvA [Amnibacterium flavum]